MKFVVSMCFLATVTIVQSQSPLHSISRPCKRENNCTEQLLHLLGRQELPQTPACFCAMGCICQQTGIFRNGVIDVTSLATLLRTEVHMDQTKANTVATTCSRNSISGVNPCDAARTLLTCMKNNGK